MFACISAAATLCGAPAAQAAPADFYYAKLNIRVCSQYITRTAALDIFYSVAGSPERYPAGAVRELAFDPTSGVATFTVALPTYYATLPVTLSAACRAVTGSGPPSGGGPVSRCEAAAYIDSDKDGLTSAQEDANCDGFYSPGDLSNPENLDTDGDNVRDLVEVKAGTDPSNPGSSPRPMIFAGGPFDPDGDGNSNAVAWRASAGTWYIRDFTAPGNHIALPFGLPGDTPIVYDPLNATSNVGVVRNMSNTLVWLFNGPGFARNNAPAQNLLNFGVFGDNIVLGPWERPGVTNPAVARLFNNMWTFFIYQQDGGIRTVNWGQNGDLPKVGDYDGDGIFDIAVFRPSEGKTYVVRSTNGKVAVYHYGSGTLDHAVHGDFTGDGIDDISFWQPLNGMFYSLKSDNGFKDALANAGDKAYFQQLQLGLYFVHVPLSWNKQGKKIIYTVVDHATGQRYFRPNNDSAAKIFSIQWGMPGDSLG